MPTTPAHSQQVTNHYHVVYPSHAPRVEDPHYAAFNAYRAANVATAVCYTGRRVGFDECMDAQGKPVGPQPNGGHGLELHHHFLEFAVINAIDLAALEVDYPNLTDPDMVGAWAETDANFLWLCIVPGTPILMAGGRWLPIERVEVGDWVIGGDGEPDRVEAVASKPYSGDTYQIGPATLTATHRVATDRGWLPIGQVADEIRVGGPDMIRLACVDDEVGWSVVRPVPVDMVDALGARQGSAEYLSRDAAMLHSGNRAQVTLLGEARGSLAGVPLRQDVQGGQPAGVGAVATLAGPPMGTGEEGGAADRAMQRRRLGWLAIDEPVRASYSGLVHDLSIAHSHSFVAGGIVVHNCAKHHRGFGGVHHAAAADWEASQYVQNLLTP